MLNSISSVNFAPKNYCLQNNIAKSSVNFGQSNDEFISSNKKTSDEKTFLQKNWGKLLIATGVVIAGIILLKKKPNKIENEINDINKSKVEETLSKKVPDEKIEPKKFKNIKTEVEKKIEDLTAKIEKDPKNLEYYHNRASLYSENAQYKKAISDYTRIIETKPKTAAPYINRGLNYKNDSQFEKALSDYTMAIKLEPKNHTAYYDKAKLLVEMNKIEEASKDISKAIELNPNEKDYAELGKYLDAKNPIPFMKRAEFHRGKQDYKQAISDYTKVINLGVNNSIIYMARGTAYETLGKNRKAMADYTSTIKADPTDAYAYAARSNVINNLSMVINKNEKALKDINKAIELNPKEADFYCERMNLYGKMGKMKEASQDETTWFSLKAGSK